MSATEYAIGRHCGVTFAGLKIASLVSLRKGEEEVIQTLSRRFAGKGFAFILLRFARSGRLYPLRRVEGV